MLCCCHYSASSCYHYFPDGLGLCWSDFLDGYCCGSADCYLHRDSDYLVLGCFAGPARFYCFCGSVQAYRVLEWEQESNAWGKKRIVREQGILKSIHCSPHTMESAWDWTKTRNSANWLTDRRCALFPHEASASSGHALRSDPILHIFYPVSLPSRKGPPAVVQATRVASQGREGKRSTGPCSALYLAPVSATILRRRSSLDRDCYLGPWR